MSQSSAIFDRLAAALAEIRPRFGAGGFSDRRRVIGLLADKVPDAKREIRAVGVAIDEGIPAALARTERQLVGVEMDRLANSLEATTGLRLDLARNVVRSFAFALDLGPTPSIYEGAGAPVPAPPPPPPAAVGGWSAVPPPVAPPPAPVSAPAPYGTPAPAGSTSQYPAYSTQPGYATAPAGFVSQPVQRPNVGGRIALGVVGLIAVALGVAQVIDSGGGEVVTNNGSGTNSGTNNVSRGSGETGFAGELVDEGIAATTELNSNLGSPTPLGIAVAERVTTAQVQQMIASDPQLLLVDVLAQEHPQTIRGAVWLPSGGSAGTFQDSYQGDFAAGLAQITGGATDRPLLFFCAGARCWESYNAALRASAAGYSRLFWYRGGLAAWAEAGLPMQPLQGGSQQQQQPQQQQQQQVEQPADQPTGDKVPTN